MTTSPHPPDDDFLLGDCTLSTPDKRTRTVMRTVRGELQMGLRPLTKYCSHADGVRTTQRADCDSVEIQLMQL